uniref:Uncharacterized protein n=1 Tax=Triticum urartu TaxID=4572 RepID=A0A8R7UV06_TRIUA
MCLLDMEREHGREGGRKREAWPWLVLRRRWIGAWAQSSCSGREDLGRDSGARLRVYAEMALLLQLLKNALRHQLDPQLKIAPLVILFNEGLALQHVVWYFLTASIQQPQLN